MFNLRTIDLYKQLLLVVMLSLASAWTLAQTTNATQAPNADAPAVTVVRTLALIAPAQQTVQEVQAVPSSNWQPFKPNATYSTKNDVALWLQLNLSVSSPPNGWSIKLPKPYIDRVELHLPSLSSDAKGSWAVQSAGDAVVHRDWPVRGLHPQFLLPALPAGQHTIFIKITNSVPVIAPVLLHSPQDSIDDNTAHLLRSVGIHMLLLCITFISACMAWVYRDTAYAWYSVYALSAALTAAAYTGLANYLLWPDAVFWPARSIHVSLLVSIALQIIFCYVAFEPQKIWPRFNAMVWLSVVLTAAGLVALFTNSNMWVYTTGLMVPMVLNWLIVMSMVTARLRLGELSAKLWMLAYLPLSAVIAAATLEGFGLLPESIVGYYWPLYCLAFEVPVLLLALMLRAKVRDAHAVTLHTRQQLDPLTGFILPRAYQETATPMWETAALLDLDFAVVYVQITQPSLPFLSARGQAPGSERIVRVLRTVFRQDDTFAQVKDDVYAMLMPGKALGEKLQNRLTRVVAQLHMLSHELKTEFPLRARIAACTNRSLPMPWPDVHRILLEKFDNEKNWDRRTICVVSKRHSQRGNDADLSNFWARAYEAEVNAIGKTVP